MTAAEEIVVTLPAPDLEAIRELVADGDVPSVADFVRSAVRVLLDDVEAGGDLAAEVLETGEPSPEMAQALEEITMLFGRRNG